jgi:thiamine-phosphate pyrophosphorylase
VNRRHLPTRWLFADERLGDRLLPVIASLPSGTGVVVRLAGVRGRRELVKRIRRIARARQLLVLDEEAGEVARVHSATELRRARLAGTPLIFVSALHPTRSHPERPPMPRMRAAALARLGRGQVYALGGMDERRFRSVKPLGFRGWGAIDAWARGRSA